MSLFIAPQLLPAGVAPDIALCDPRTGVFSSGPFVFYARRRRRQYLEEGVWKTSDSCTESCPSPPSYNVDGYDIDGVLDVD